MVLTRERPETRPSPALIRASELPAADTQPKRSGATVALVVGAAVALIGFLDVVMAWYPLGFGRVEWEFGIISRTFDGLPLATAGVGAVLGGLIARRTRVGLKVFAGVAAAALLVLVGLVTLYLISFTELWSEASEAVRQTLKFSLVRTGSFMAIYTIVYGWMAWFALSNARSSGRETVT